MIKEVIDNWNKNKNKLEKYFSTTKQEEYDSYEKIIKRIVQYILPDFNIVYDDIEGQYFGDYQGIGIFLIPTTLYPHLNEIIYTHNYYGSCSGCDTLLSINNYGSGLPTKEQVEDYMLLCLHLVENMRYFKENDNGER